MIPLLQAGADVVAGIRTCPRRTHWRAALYRREDRSQFDLSASRAAMPAGPLFPNFYGQRSCGFAVILNARRRRPLWVARKQKKTAKRPKTILRIPDLEQSKIAVLNSPASPSPQESYGHAIEEFIGSYCSEFRLALFA